MTGKVTARGCPALTSPVIAEAVLERDVDLRINVLVEVLTGRRESEDLKDWLPTF